MLKIDFETSKLCTFWQPIWKLGPNFFFGDNLLSVDPFLQNSTEVTLNEGQTPLHLAAKNGHLEICRLILANVNDKNPVNHDGETPSQLAAYHGHLPVMELIKSALSKKGSKFRRTIVRSYAEAMEGTYLGQ